MWFNPLFKEPNEINLNSCCDFLNRNINSLRLLGKEYFAFLLNFLIINIQKSHSKNRFFNKILII